MSNLNPFRDQSIQDNEFYDEGPIGYVSNLVFHTSSIDTTNVDQYRQGVEITQQKHYTLGLVKIHAGDSGHVLKQNIFGEDETFHKTTKFNDISNFDPKSFIDAQSTARHSSVVQQFNSSIEEEVVENIVFDGVLEPLSIRTPITLDGKENEQLAHCVRASLQEGGNETESITIDTIFKKDSRNLVAFNDQLNVTIVPATITASYAVNNTKAFRYTKNTSFAKFTDERYNRNAAVSTSYASDMITAMSLMTGSSDGYIKSIFEEKSATAGWQYDYNQIGTDSLAFGGMTY
jgi:hypothetical protein